MTEPVAGCTGKCRFIAFSHAAIAAKRRRRKDSNHVEAYHCMHCNGYHVGERRSYGQKDRRKQET